MSCACGRFQNHGHCYHENTPPMELPPEAYRVERDRGFEQAFIDEVQELAARMSVPPDGSFGGLVFWRSDSSGARNYGDTAFLTDDRNLLQEAREEAADFAVYAMFECEKRGYVPGHEVRHWLTAGAAHMAAADWCLRQARQVESD